MELRRWLRGLFGRRRVVPLDPDRTDLVVVVESFDDVEACSRVLERAAASAPRWTESTEAVLRHHLRVPRGELARVAEIAAQDGYLPAPEPGPDAVPDEDPDLVALVLARVQLLDALHCSQERSRMAGLAQRAGGHVLGWDALQPPQNPVAGTD